MKDNTSIAQNVNTLVGINRLWQYFYENLPDFEDAEVVIAMNESNGCEICMTDHWGFPEVNVYVNGQEVNSDIFSSESDMAESMRFFYVEYLLNNKIVEEYEMENEIEYPTTEEIEEWELMDMRDEQELRDEELYSSFITFVSSACDGDDEYVLKNATEDELYEMMEAVLRIIGSDYGWPVYRPTLYENDDGTYDYVKFPYDEVTD